jgi:hypothetical protein
MTATIAKEIASLELLQASMAIGMPIPPCTTRIHGFLSYSN